VGGIAYADTVFSELEMLPTMSGGMLLMGWMICWKQAARKIIDETNIPSG
jgi:hypothetical protein